MEKKTRLNKKKLIICILAVLIIIALLIVILFALKPKKEEEQKKPEIQVQVEDKIDDYGYELEDNETKYYKELFENLKSVLNEETLNEEKYASAISQLFLADFFNLDNKLSKNDIGGIQFVYSSFQAEFEKLAKAGIYHYVESNIYGEREQQLPIVKEVAVSSVKVVPVTYLGQADEQAYQVELTIAYEEDLGYQTKATLLLVHNENKLEIIKMTE